MAWPIPQTEFFLDDAGNVFGIDIHEHVHLGLDDFLQIALILLASALSMSTTKKEIREANDFEWGPIAQVAKLFIGIFITMIPACGFPAKMARRLASILRSSSSG